MPRKLTVVSIIVVALGLGYFALVPDREGTGSNTSGMGLTFDVADSSRSNGDSVATEDAVEPEDIDHVNLESGAGGGRVDERLAPPVSLLPQSQVRFNRLLKTLFENEPIDQDWAPPMESRLYESLASLGLSIAALSVHCRTNMCRMEVIVNDTHADYSMQFMRAIEPFWTDDAVLAKFIDTARGDPFGSGAADIQYWQAYLVGNDVAQAVEDEVGSWARERFRQRSESQR